MYRFNPRTHRFSYHAHNPPNPHGGDFDYWGYHFATSATGGEAYQIREDGNGKFKMHELFKKTVRPVPSSGIISSQHFPEKNNQNFIILNEFDEMSLAIYEKHRLLAKSDLSASGLFDLDTALDEYPGSFTSMFMDQKKDAQWIDRRDS